MGARETSESTWVQVQGYATQGDWNSYMAQGNPWKGEFRNKRGPGTIVLWKVKQLRKKMWFLVLGGWLEFAIWFYSRTVTNSVIIESLNK